MSSDDISNAFTATKSDLSSLGVDDAAAREILASRLLVERLGEEDNNNWWESVAMTSTGRDRLVEVLPKTASKARLDLAQEVGRKAEQDRLTKNSISLFYLGPTAEAQIEAELEAVSAEQVHFDALEALEYQCDERGWSKPIVPDVESIDPETSGHIRIGSVTESELRDRTVFREAANRCLLVYGFSTVDELRVPYYEVEI